MPTIRHDQVLLRLVKDVADIRANLRRVVANLPLYDIASENTPAVLTSNQNNYVPGNYDVLILSSTRNVSITGIRNGVKGRRLQIFNVGNYSIILPNESQDSDAKNRFSFQSGSGVALQPGESVTIYYYATIQRWIFGEEIAEPTITWKAQTCPSGLWNAVTYSPLLDLFVAVGDGSGGNFVMTSSDGETWSAIVGLDPVGGAWNDVIWIDNLGLFVAVGSGSTWKLMTSPDGINWTGRNSAAGAEAMYGVAYSPDLNIIVSVGGDRVTNSTANKIQTSSDGINWSAATSAQTKVWEDIAWSADLGLFVTVGAIAGSSTYYSSKSSNGTSWTGTDMTSGNRTNVTYAPSLGIFLALTFGGGAGAYSINGINWINITNSAYFFQATDFVWSEELGIFLSTYIINDYSYYSMNGFEWHAVKYAPLQCYSICWAKEKSLFVALGNGTAMTYP